MESKNVENNKGIENGEMILENVDELRDDFHTLGSDGFNHCPGEKYIVTFFFKVRSRYGQIKAKIDIILSPSILS